MKKRALFSVVIPTLQKSHRLGPLVELYCAHELVGEVLIINNAAEPLNFDHPKVRVLQQQTNIFVNPAWNLGAGEAQFPLLAISNDDIAIPPAMLDAAARLLRLPIGIIGPDLGPFRRKRSGRSWARPAYRRPVGFGTLMFMRADAFVPVPEDLQIWSGDDWLFYQQTHRNLLLVGFSVETEMETTSGRPEFDSLKRLDQATYFSKYHTNAYATRFWLGHAFSKLEKVRANSLPGFQTPSAQRLGRSTTQELSRSVTTPCLPTKGSSCHDALRRMDRCHRGQAGVIAVIGAARSRGRRR